MSNSANRVIPKNSLAMLVLLIFLTPSQGKRQERFPAHCHGGKHPRKVQILRTRKQKEPLSVATSTPLDHKPPQQDPAPYPQTPKQSVPSTFEALFMPPPCTPLQPIQPAVMPLDVQARSVTPKATLGQRLLDEDNGRRYNNIVWLRFVLKKKKKGHTAKGARTITVNQATLSFRTPALPTLPFCGFESTSTPFPFVSPITINKTGPSASFHSSGDPLEAIFSSLASIGLTNVLLHFVFIQDNQRAHE
ncbi:hypothetical protein BU17DRAFT_103745 [Hysterangium stoloniferum]|nr:hypothetical protein BU17DRAFT_103745 [Hysterangium stoloniferum]